jgi:aarF domain-containing kinase
VLETAITGRVNLDQKADSLLANKKMDDNELKKLRAAVMEREGLILEIFELLRRVPKRLLMILKLSDLQRSLDHSLHTTHGTTRIFVIVARYCAEAVWQDDKALYRRTGELRPFIKACFSHVYWATTFGVAEKVMDLRARWVKMTLWVRGLAQGGWEAAGRQAAGIDL